MAHNPHAPQGPEGTHDPAGSTQMFRAFVDEGEPQRRPQPAATASGPKVGVIVGVVAVIVVARRGRLARARLTIAVPFTAGPSPRLRGSADRPGVHARVPFRTAPAPHAGAGAVRVRPVPRPANPRRDAAARCGAAGHGEAAVGGVPGAPAAA